MLRGSSTCLRRDDEGALVRAAGRAGAVAPVVHFQLGLTLMSIGYASFVFVTLK